MRERGLENTFQRFYSNYQAKVISCEDEKQLGRASVRLESLGYPDDHPGMADVYTPYGGNDFGFFFPPYEGDDVYVSFDHGDPSSPMVMGSWWGTEGQKQPDDSELPMEFVNTTTNDEGQEVGAAPVVRGIKVRTGSALVFDETEDLQHVELWSGESQGKGKRAIKHHRVRLDDRKDNGQVVVATFGDENSSAETISDMDSTDERDRKELEGRLRHQILMRDTTSDRFAEFKTIGEDAMSKFHKLRMSDTDKNIVLSSWDQHFVEVNDDKDFIHAKTAGDYSTIWDEGNKKVIQKTGQGQTLTMDDNATSNTLETSAKQVFKQAQEGTSVTDPVGYFNVDATTDSMHTYKAGLTRSITGALTTTIQAATQWTGQAFTWMGTVFTYMGTTMNVTVASMTVTSPSVVLGTGSIQPLLNTTALATYNSHIHIVVGVTPGVALPTLNVMAPGNDTTVATTAA